MRLKVAQPAPCCLPPTGLVDRATQVTFTVALDSLGVDLTGDDFSLSIAGPIPPGASITRGVDTSTTATFTLVIPANSSVHYP